jgi:hypothetical protein
VPVRLPEPVYGPASWRCFVVGCLGHKDEVGAKVHQLNERCSACKAERHGGCYRDTCPCPCEGKP